ncbi:ATP-dependent RecD-like DNA helicase [Mycoplasmopsis synoviae]|uniref:ATP-dependent DNA helicase n=1 Tax=Mycoplasmopsis synoviae TaxID=2109 RepID=UPI0034DAFEA7
MKDITQLVGKFTKIKAGGPEVGWGLYIFQSTDSLLRNCMVYITKKSVGSMPTLFRNYKIDLVNNSNPNYKNSSKTLVAFTEFYEDQLTQEEKNKLLETILLKVKNLGKVKIERIIKNFGFDIFKHHSDIDALKEQTKDILTNLQIESLYEYFQNHLDLIKSSFLNSKEISNFDIFIEQNKLSELKEFLVKKHPSNFDFLKHYKVSDPYVWYNRDEFDNFALLDYFALKLNWGMSCDERINALTKFCFLELITNNSTMVELRLLNSKIKEFIHEENSYWNGYPEDKNELEKTFKVVREIDGKIYVALSIIYDKEKKIASFLKMLNSLNPIVLDSLSDSETKTLSEGQKNAYESFLKNNITIISGAPGTGKSHIIKHIHNTLKQNKYKNQKEYAILAPTGKASLSVSEKINAKVSTIHSFLQIEPSSEHTIKVKQINTEVKFLIIDEFSMVNTYIFNLLIRACPNLIKLVLVGDVDQLPAIGPGNLLSDIVESKLFNVFYLDKYFRSDSIEIFNHFNSIKTNSPPNFKDGIINYIKYLDSKYLSSVVDLFCEIAKESGLDNLMLLSPMKVGDKGLDAINKKIQDLINPDSELVYSTKFGNKFKINDRVIQQENRLDDDVYNGDIGFIRKKIGTKTQDIKILVEFKNNKLIKYPLNEFLSQIKLAYGITVHKFQGSEIDNVIFAFADTHKRMLYKNLIYTGLSRAKKQIWIVTNNKIDYPNLIKEIQNETPIYTNLKYILKGK